MLISIIIPIYNSSSFLTRCIQSILDQTYRKWELILVDDGSTDDSLSICHFFSTKDSRISVLSQTNAGASAARNQGLKIAKGEWLMFVDSDDWIECDMIESMLSIALNIDVDVIQTRVPSDMTHQIGDCMLTGSGSVLSLLEGSWWGPCCKLIRKEALGGLLFPIKTISEDYLFNYQLFSKISRLFYVDKCYYHRQVHPGSLSRMSLSERKFDEFYNVKEVSDAVAQDFPAYLQLADKHLAGTCLKLLFLVFDNNAEKEYSTYLNLIMREIRKKYFSFMLNPFIHRNERILLAGCVSRMSSRFIYQLYRYVKSH